MLSLKYYTAWRIVNQFNRTGNVSAKKSGNDTRSKLNQKQKNEVLSWVDNNCLLKLKNLMVKVEEKFNILTSKSAINRILYELHYAMKSTVLMPERRNDTRTIDIREQYAEKFRRLETEKEHSNLNFLMRLTFRSSLNQKSAVQ